MSSPVSTNATYYYTSTAAAAATTTIATATLCGAGTANGDGKIAFRTSRFASHVVHVPHVAHIRRQQNLPNGKRRQRDVTWTVEIHVVEPAQCCQWLQMCAYDVCPNEK